jgi:MFS family permease
MNSNKWYLNSIIFGTLIIAFDCLLLIFPEKYFSLKLNFIGYKSDKKEEYIISNDPEKISFFEEKEEKNNKTGFLKTIMKNKVYIFSILANFFFYLVKFIINLNILNYIITSYYFPNSYKQFMVSSQKTFSDFAIVFGYLYEIIGLLCIGGYENKNSAIFLGINSILNFISSLFLFFSNNSSHFSIGYFLYIFFSPSINYINICFLINLLPNKYKGSGFALNLVFEAIGMIGPVIYGLLQDNFGKHNPTLPWKINIIFIIFETTFCLIATYYRYYYIEEEIKDDNEKELEIIA